MKIRGFLITTSVSGLGMWLLAGLWHEVIMRQFYTEATHASHEGTGVILLAYLILAALMTYLFILGYRGQRPIRHGLHYGVVLGLLWVFPHELAMAGAHGEPVWYVIKNALWHVIEQGIGGLIIGLVYSKLLVR